FFAPCVFAAPSSRYRIVLTFTFMETECTYDYLFIYDGDSYSSPLLASLSGSTLPEVIEARSGKMLLHLFSDANYNLLGFNATFAFSLCPLDCSGHGVCNSIGQCNCHPGWVGEGCNQPSCSVNCSLHGTCSSDNRFCQCKPGFIGQSCDLSLRDNQGAGSWYEVSPGNGSLSPRTAAAGVFLNTTNALYIFGGFDLNNAMENLVIYNFTSNHWEQLMCNSLPDARHSHIAVEWLGNMVIFGGELANGSLASDVWMYSPLNNSWKELSHSNAPGAPKLANHAAAVVNNHLYVFGGRTNEDMFSSELYRFALESKLWELVQPSGGKPPAAAGHSMVFHAASRTLLVYGGHRPSTARFSMRVNTTDAFHVDQLYWTTFRSRYPINGPRERAFHSATVIGNYMVIYGECFLPKQKALLKVKGVNKPHLCYFKKIYCGNTFCLGLARFLPDCQSCLIFSGHGESLPQAPNTFGWCVQNESCAPVSEFNSCKVDPISGAYGWWGQKTRFITSLEECQRDNFTPGIHLLTYQNPRNDSQPDKVSIVRSTSITLNPSTEMDVTLAFKGFIHPLWNNAGPWDIVSVWARIQRLYVVGKIAKGPNSTELTEELGRWTVQQEKISRLLQRPNGERLFQALDRGNKYAIQVEGYLNNSGNGQTSELTLTWNRTSVLGGSEISFLFLEPFSSDSCSSYRSCLACLADQSCGWCPHSSTCLQRIDSHGNTTQCADGTLQFILSPANCMLCEDYRDCESCTKDQFCEWQINSNKKGDFLCSRRGRIAGSIRSPVGCPTLCNQRSTCGECLSNSSQCAWCESAQACFFFAAYLTKYPFGECRDWYDSVHSVPQCMDCSRYVTCRDCLQNFECGWCGNEANPTLGSCLHGDFSGLKDSHYPNCSVAVSERFVSLPPEEPSLWSYRTCPDVDECQLGMHSCHAFATCHNTLDSFECHCNRGYTGDGVTHCNKTCYNECMHGECSGPPDYMCICHLGWTSNSSSVNQTGIECDLDCGCNFHSTCQAGLGLCDHCQGWTMGEHCEHCWPGSFGSALDPGGCKQCACNGHGLESLGICNVTSGVCFCEGSTEGEYCERCVAGYYGDPRNNGTCYQQCSGRNFLSSITSSALGSAKGMTVSEQGLSYCLWVLSTTNILEPCPIESRCPSISLTIQPDIHTHCTNNYLFVFDGLPEFLNNGVVRSDRNLIGVFCGTSRTDPITIEASSGIVTVYFEANVTDVPGSHGFNTTYRVSRCQSGCSANQECVNRRCVCKNRFAGPDCSLVVCPSDCDSSKGHGICNMSLGLCVCSNGYAGPDCSTPVDSGKVIWETLMDTQYTTNKAHRFLLRMGHSLVEGPDSTLWMFGGLSLLEGILGNVYRYSIPERRWTQMLTSTTDGSPGPCPRYFHAAAYVPGHNTMFVVGGLTEKGVASDMWGLNLTTLQWKQESSLLLPAVAGHTLTLRRNYSLLLFGGYSPENGFNNKLLEFNLQTGNWSVGLQTGTPPTGLYGHTAVYHEGTDAVYLFGGYRFHMESVAASAELYSLHYPNLTWSLLAPSQGSKPLSRFFHAAAIYRDTMVVVGGRTELDEFSDGVLFYQITCNTWIQPNISESMIGTPLNASVSHAMATANGQFFVTGGFNGVALGRMLTLTVPYDPCLVLSTQHSCNSSSGSCIWCRTSCVSSDTAERLGCGSGKSQCFPMPRSAGECRRLKTCSECLARHPRTIGLAAGQLLQQCKWCTNCPEGACISSDGSCTSENDCRINQREIFVASNCSEISCEASDCPKCTASGKCMWTRQFKRTVSKSARSSVFRFLSTFVDSPPPATFFLFHEQMTSEIRLVPHFHCGHQETGKHTLQVKSLNTPRSLQVFVKNCVSFHFSIVEVEISYIHPSIFQPAESEHRVTGVCWSQSQPTQGTRQGTNPGQGANPPQDTHKHTHAPSTH
uniref:Multiple EGF like domains 8 n=1 Tax=Erpetoichthys calabaricus TaxID=27687 RepID=A0A8C4SXY5_ERPCA